MTECVTVTHFMEVRIMAEFNIGLARCRVREYAQGVLGEYIIYLRENGINPLEQPEHPLVKNKKELLKMDRRADKCETEDDIKMLNARIDELRAIIK